jgi:hypothetical protein
MPKVPEQIPIKNALSSLSEIFKKLLLLSGMT